MKSKIKEFKCDKGVLVEITLLDHFERDIPVNSDYKDNEYTEKVYGMYLGDNEYYHFIEWAEQGSTVNVEPHKRIFGILKNSIIDYKIFNCTG